MTQLNDFQSRLQEKMVLLDELDKTLQSGGTPDIAPISADIEQLCQEMIAASSDILEAMQPSIQEMLLRLKGIIAKLNEESGEHEKNVRIH